MIFHSRKCFWKWWLFCSGLNVLYNHVLYRDRYIKSACVLRSHGFVITFLRIQWEEITHPCLNAWYDLRLKDIFWQLNKRGLQGADSILHKISYRKISLSFTPTSSSVKMLFIFGNLVGGSAALLPSLPAKFQNNWKTKHEVKSYDKMSYVISKLRPDLPSQIVFYNYLWEQLYAVCSKDLNVFLVLNVFYEVIY